MTAPLAVHAFDLWKRFGDKVAVAGLTLQVPDGSFFGLVGPNGAGKTTTLRMVVGLLRPDGGAITVGGVPSWPDPRAVKKDVATFFRRPPGARAPSKGTCH